MSRLDFSRFVFPSSSRTNKRIFRACIMLLRDLLAEPLDQILHRVLGNPLATHCDLLGEICWRSRSTKFCTEFLVTRSQLTAICWAKFSSFFTSRRSRS